MVKPYIRKDNKLPAQFMLDWNVETGYRGLTREDDVHLRLHALSQAHDVALADGDPPQNKPGNPQRLAMC